MRKNMLNRTTNFKTIQLFFLLLLYILISYVCTLIRVEKQREERFLWIEKNQCFLKMAEDLCRSSEYSVWCGVTEVIWGICLLSRGFIFDVKDWRGYKGHRFINNSIMKQDTQRVQKKLMQLMWCFPFSYKYLAPSC